VSLLAILVTLAAIALVAGIAIPAWFSRHDVTLDNAALLLARDLRAVQNRAAFLGEPARLQFDEHGWKATDSSGRLLSRYGGEEPFSRRLDADGVFEDVSLRAIQFGEDDAVSFGPDGTALEGGSLEVHFRSEHRLVRLSMPQGEVHIEGMARPWNDDGR
jgi:Tfp pilus assembly protein FimT